jgi:PAS domain S-box-containing protein
MVNSFCDLKEDFLLNKALDIFSGLIFLIDRQGTYLDYYADENLLFAPPEVFLGKKISDIMPKETAVKEMSYVNKLFETKQNQSYENTLEINGEPQHFIVNFVYYDENSLLSFVQDVTDLKKVRTNLKESEELYHHLFDSAPLAIILFDEKGGYIDLNEGTERMLGYSRDELIGNRFQDYDIVSERLEKIFEKRLSDLFRGKELAPMEFKAKTKEGKHIWLRTDISLITLSKKKLAMVISQDITERKQAELELKKLSSLKSELLRRTSHELKTPLVSIKGFADLLLELFKERMNKKMVEIIKEIKHGCLRLQNLIKDILKTAEIESGKLIVQKSKQNLIDIIKESVNELRGFAELRKHQIQLDLEESIFVYIEKEHIHQVISNLLTNAIKYTPLGGLISIHAYIEDKKAHVTIEDTGIGLTDEEKGKIFHQFGKIEHFGEGFDIVSEGSGLGLYITKKIINLHNGNIWVESEGRNKGSTFHFTLPIISKKS